MSVPEGWITSRDVAGLIGRKESRTRDILRGMSGAHLIPLGKTRTFVIRKDDPELVRLIEEESSAQPPEGTVTLSELLALTGQTRQQVEAGVAAGKVKRVGKFRAPFGSVVWYYHKPE